jgi:hypothetical protein
LNCENKFAILENPDGKNVDSNRAWESVRLLAHKASQLILNESTQF